MEKPFPEQSPADFGKAQSSQGRSHHLHAVSIIPGNIYLPFPWVKALLGSALCTQGLCRGFFPLPAQAVFKPCSKKGIFHQLLKQQVSPAKCKAGHSPPPQLFSPCVRVRAVSGLALGTCRRRLLQFSVCWQLPPLPPEPAHICPTAGAPFLPPDPAGWGARDLCTPRFLCALKKGCGGKTPPLTKASICEFIYPCWEGCLFCFGVETTLGSQLNCAVC